MTLTVTVDQVSLWMGFSLQASVGYDAKKSSHYQLLSVDTGCFDLSQVCDCQQQFARWEDGQQRDLPCFRGCKGPEFTRTLLEIEGNFQRGLQNLHSVDKAILDVKDTTWNNEFNRLIFCS